MFTISSKSFEQQLLYKSHGYVLLDLVCTPPFSQRLVIHEKRWIIPKPGCSLYLRPVALGTEPCVSARGTMDEPTIFFSSIHLFL